MQHYRLKIANIKNLNKTKYEFYFSLLPRGMQEDVDRFKQEEDRHRTLLGKIILMNYLKKYTRFSLDDIQKDYYGKPNISDGSFYFNISHSKDLVVCAFSKLKPIGVDIEMVESNINIEEFFAIFSDDELELIKKSNDKSYTFYRLWTMKEAILKAYGKGFSSNPLDIELDLKNNSAKFKEKAYRLYIPMLKFGYICSVAISS
jgi:4'-phosphopantetheinyl transferase